jgi:hypothetical protein
MTKFDHFLGAILSIGHRENSNPEKQTQKSQGNNGLGFFYFRERWD